VHADRLDLVSSASASLHQSIARLGSIASLLTSPPRLHLGQRGFGAFGLPRAYTPELYRQKCSDGRSEIGIILFICRASLWATVAIVLCFY
jgi:hypothetical protein